MCHATGFRRDQITDLCVLVHAAWNDADHAEARLWGGLFVSRRKGGCC